MTKKKKRTRMLIAVAVIAVLVVIYILVSRADFNAEVEETIVETEVFSVDVDDITSAVVVNSYGTLTFYCDGETWTSGDDPDISLDQDALVSLWNRLSPLTAVRDLGEITENLDDYGLEDPVITITLTMSDGTVTSVFLGNETSDDNLYFMTSESGHVYTGDTYLATAFDFDLDDYEEEEEEEEEDAESEDEETAEDGDEEDESADEADESEESADEESESADETDESEESAGEEDGTEESEETAETEDDGDSE